MNEKPLFLPKGSIRSILILVMTGWLLASIWYNKIVPESIIILWAGCIGWYFGGKIDSIKNQNDV